MHLDNAFKDGLFEIENALGMYADSFVTLPAEAIYDKNILENYDEIIKSCHIYLIGLLPAFEIINSFKKESNLTITVSALSKTYNLIWPVPEDAILKKSNDMYYLEDKLGQRFTVSNENILKKLNSEFQIMNFDVKYIGQAYGKDGSRNAIDRLKKHETLQKISLKGIPDGYTLSLLLLDIKHNTQLVTVINPWAENNDSSDRRIKDGLDKLFDTSEKERTTLYEASLIRYFTPTFNKEFKNSFPSTNLSVLQDCYEKDFSAVIAEICHDDIPFKLYSDTVKPSPFHIAKHDLHKETNRKVFFGL